VPLLADDLPEPLVAKLKGKIAAVERTVDAAVSGDREAMLEALLADGGVTDPGGRKGAPRRPPPAHRAHLPQFA
jgi:alpha-galactosidase